MSTRSFSPAVASLPPVASPARPRRATRALLLAAASIVCGVGLGCSSSSTGTTNDGSGGDAAALGSPVVGAVDTHCAGVTPVVINPLSCSATVDPDAGAPPGDGGATSEFGATIYNAEGDDDDCKYHLKFSTALAAIPSGSLTFKFALTKLADGSPASGAIDAQGDGVAIEGYLESNLFHVLPNTTPATTATESPAGSGLYTVTPVKLDASGRWVIRFHLYETCSDGLDDSPHGHVAFFFDVP